MQRVHEQRHAELRGFGEEFLEARIPERYTVHVTADLHAAESLGMQLCEFPRGQRRILQRDHPQAVKAAIAGRQQFTDEAVHVPRQGQCVRRLQPVREQLRHRGQYLAAHAFRVHRGDPRGRIPRARVEFAERPGSHVEGHALRVRIRESRPAAAARRGVRKAARHHVRMDVDEFAGHSVPLTGHA